MLIKTRQCSTDATDWVPGIRTATKLSSASATTAVHGISSRPAPSTATSVPTATTATAGTTATTFPAATVLPERSATSAATPCACTTPSSADLRSDRAVLYRRVI